MLTITPIPAFNDNYIWMFHQPDSQQAFVVDPGDAEAVEAALQENHLELAGMLITHHHFDHTGGVSSLIANREIPVYGPDNPQISDVTHVVKNKDQFDVLGISFKAMTTPGHTLDHIVYFTETGDSGLPALFCGDTLFSAGCGRLFEGDAEQMYQSLSQISDLPKNTLIYPAHEYTLANLEFALVVEPDNQNIIKRKSEVTQLRQQLNPSLPVSLATELETNPFLRSKEKPVITAAVNRGAPQNASADTILRVIREWKDQF